MDPAGLLGKLCERADPPPFVGPRDRLDSVVSEADLAGVDLGGEDRLDTVERADA